MRYNLRHVLSILLVLALIITQTNVLAEANEKKGGILGAAMSLK